MGPHSKIGLEGLLLEIWSGSAHQDRTLRLGAGDGIGQRTHHSGPLG